MTAFCLGSYAVFGFCKSLEGGNGPPLIKKMLAERIQRNRSMVQTLSHLDEPETHVRDARPISDA